MIKLGWFIFSIDFFELFGVFEILLYVKVLVKIGKYVGIVVSGLVVDGGIYCYDFVV